MRTRTITIAVAVGIFLTDRVPAASAQTGAKLAVARIEVTPTLAKKYATIEQPTPAPNPVPAGTSMDGSWEGVGMVLGGRADLNLLIEGSRGSAMRAFLENRKTRKSWSATTAVRNGMHIRLTFPGDGGTWEAEVELRLGKMSATWTRNRGKSFPLTLTRTGGIPAPAPVAAPVVVSGPSLEDVSHAVEVRLLDRLHSARLFTIVDDAQLKETVPPSGKWPDQQYDPRNAGTVEQFKKAGIRYLLLTTVEDFECQGIDVAKRELELVTGNVNMQRAGRSSSEAGARVRPGRVGASQNHVRAGTMAGSATASQIHFDSQITRKQVVRLSVRYRLFDTSAGSLLTSDTHSFETNRPVLVLAEGNNAPAFGDLVEAAARNVSEWLMIKTCEATFPIKVLEKAERDITINRGLETGLAAGQIFAVYANGKEVKEPDTGSVLGRQELTVGKVVISELHQNFSKARILDDQGIVAGAALRRVLAN